MGHEANVDNPTNREGVLSLGENMSWFFVGKWEVGNYILAKIGVFFLGGEMGESPLFAKIGRFLELWGEMGRKKS